MTATDELRRLLDERGVEWDYGITGADTTRFVSGGVDLTFTPMRDWVICSTLLTPSQAIAATLGVTDATATRQGVAGLESENAKLRELVLRADRLMQGVLDNATDTVTVSDLPCCDTLYDNLGIYREDMRDLGIEVDE